MAPFWLFKMAAYNAFHCPRTIVMMMAKFATRPVGPVQSLRGAKISPNGPGTTLAFFALELSEGFPSLHVMYDRFAVPATKLVEICVLFWGRCCRWWMRHFSNLNDPRRSSIIRTRPEVQTIFTRLALNLFDGYPTIFTPRHATDSSISNYRGLRRPVRHIGTRLIFFSFWIFLMFFFFFK